MNIKELLIQPKTTETMIISMALDRVMMQDKGSGEERVGMHGSGVVASEADFC
jgi:hypothetical protein